MTSDVFGARRPQSLDGLGSGLAAGSFEEMRVKVTCPITCECITPEHLRELVLHLHVTHDATCYGVLPHVVHLVDLALKAEQFRSGPGAIAWIFVCERARSVTPRALDVSRDKCHVSCFL